MKLEELAFSLPCQQLRFRKTRLLTLAPQPSWETVLLPLRLQHFYFQITLYIPESAFLAWPPLSSPGRVLRIAEFVSELLF